MLGESLEMYLETIYVLNNENSVVRSIDIAQYMGYSRASVSRAIGILKDGEYISVNKKGYISLTNLGIEIALKLYERHIILSKIFKALGVDEETASEDACRIEHIISEKTFNAIKEYFEKSLFCLQTE